MMREPIDIQQYLTEGVEAIVKDALRATLRDPKESLFMARFAAASRMASERRAENEREGQKTEIYRFTVEHMKEKKAAEVYRIAESDWMNVNVGDQIFITAKRSGADPCITDKDGNKIAELVRER